MIAHDEILITKSFTLSMRLVSEI